MSPDRHFEPVRPVRLYESIVLQIEQAVASGELRPGARLPSERELTQQFGASRATVREALRVLESHGVVASRPGDPRGPEVLAFHPDLLAKQLTRLAQGDEVGLDDLIGFRMLVDGAASLLAAHRRTDEDIARMTDAIEAMRAAIPTGYAAFSPADLSFHDAVAVASGNKLLQVCTAVVRGVVLSLVSDRIAHARNHRALMRRSLEHHQEVLDAIRAGDGAGAAASTRSNMYDYYASYVPAADREALRLLAQEPTGRRLG